VQGVESNGQNQSPGHQAQEGGEHLKADHGQGQGEAGANEDVEKESGDSPFELGIGIVQSAHRCSPHGYSCDMNAVKVVDQIARGDRSWMTSRSSLGAAAILEDALALPREARSCTSSKMGKSWSLSIVSGGGECKHGPVGTRLEESFKIPLNRASLEAKTPPENPLQIADSWCDEGLVPVRGFEPRSRG